MAYKDHIMGKGKARVMTNNLEGHEALEKLGEEFEDNIQPHDICELSTSSGVCGT